MPPSLNKVSPDYIAHVAVSKSDGIVPDLALLVEDALDFCHCHGLVLRTKEYKNRSDICQAAPFALFPSPFPRKLYDQALAVQKAMNLLYFLIAWDYDFLIEAHKSVIQSDDFTRNMIDILKDVHKIGIKQHITLLTQRSDYMCHVKEGGKKELKQIEVNNIAVSMGGLAQRATLLHRRMLSKAGFNETKTSDVPDNYPITTLAEGIHLAWKKFDNPNALMLVVVGKVNQNQFDQRYVEYEVEHLSAGQIIIVRLTLSQCSERLHLDTNDFSLHLDGNVVGIVYFRAGYSPEDYASRKEWDARRTIECSTAIKCPWIGLQLANTKKVQQVLAMPGMVERFLPDPIDAPVVKSIRDTFAGMWGLEHDDDATRSIIKDAIAYPNRYVLKPQLEGGGGNYFGQKIVDKLQAFTPVERAAHILMEKIQPMVVKNYLVRPFEEYRLSNVVSELGIYGCLVGDGDGARERKAAAVLHNQAHGHILRTKAEHINEGGVAVGAAVIDTPYLF